MITALYLATTSFGVPARRQHRVPEIDVETRQPLFGQRRQIRCDRLAFLAGNCDQLDLVVAGHRHDDVDRLKACIDMATDKILRRAGRAAIRNVLHVGVCG